MKIVKNKKESNSYSITGLTLGKLMALQTILEKGYANGKLTTTGAELRNTMNSEMITLEK